MVTIRSSLRALYSAAAIAGATAGGDPAAGTAMAGYLRTPVGKAAMDAAIDFTLANEDVDTANMAMGGLVTQPTLAMVGEAGPELIIPLTKTKRRRKKSNYSKALSKALKEVNLQQRKKNGSYKKGKSASTVLAAAHKKARRMTKK